MVEALFRSRQGLLKDFTPEEEPITVTGENTEIMLQRLDMNMLYHRQLKLGGHILRFPSKGSSLLDNVCREIRGYSGMSNRSHKFPNIYYT